MSHETINGVNYNVRTRVVDGKETQIYYKDGKGYIKGADGKLQELHKVKDSAFKKAEYETEEYHFEQYKKTVASNDLYHQRYHVKASDYHIRCLYKFKDYYDTEGRYDSDKVKGNAPNLVGRSYDFEIGNTKLKGIIRYDADKNEMWLQTKMGRFENENTKELGIEAYRALAYDFPIHGDDRYGYASNRKRAGYYVKTGKNKEEFMTPAQFKDYCAKVRAEKEEREHNEASYDFAKSVTLPDGDFRRSGIYPNKKVLEKVEGDRFKFRTNTGQEELTIHSDEEGNLIPYKDESVKGTDSFKVQKRTYYAKKDLNEEYNKEPAKNGYIRPIRLPEYGFVPNTTEYIITFNDGREPLTMTEQEYQASEYSKIEKKDIGV